MTQEEQKWYEELWQGFKEIPISDNSSTVITTGLLSKLKELRLIGKPKKEMRLIAKEILSILTSLPHSSEKAIQRLNSLL